MKDFFISYNRADEDWAKWIAWVLEEEGYSTVIQVWDFRPGENFVLDMHNALLSSRATLAVLSEQYLNAAFTHPEWAAAFAADPKGAKRLLIPLMVRECKPAGLLSQIVYVKLVGLAEPEARAALLGAFRGGRPAVAPAYPGSESPPSDRDKPVLYPGRSGRTKSDAVMERLTATVRSDIGRHSVSESIGLTVQQRMALMRDLNALPAELFNMLVVALKPTNGLISPMPAPQAERSSQLLRWAESSVGCGLHELIEALAETTGTR